MKKLAILLAVLALLLSLGVACAPAPASDASAAATIAAAKATEAAAQATEAAAAQAVIEATQMASGLPTDTPAPGPKADEETMKGMILFVTETEVISGTQSIDKLDLYSITGGQVKLVASSVKEEFALSPDGTMLANYDQVRCELQLIALDARSGIATEYDTSTKWVIENVLWSPDGTQLAVQTECSVDVLTPATGTILEITHECYAVGFIEEGPEHVTWSPDGNWLAFDILNNQGGLLPYLVDDLHGDRPAKLVVVSADNKVYKELDEHGAYPVWSPDGQRILYTGGWRRDGDDVYCNENLYIINVDGSGKVQLAETTGHADDSYKNPYYGERWSSDYEELGWSSDGEHVFFTQGRPELFQLRDSQLSVIHPDGTGKVTLDDEPWGVVYLPQTNRITWRKQSDPNNRMFISNLDGTNKITLAEVGYPFSFSPCGNKLVGEHESEKWVISNLEGSEMVTLPSQPTFSPDCTKAAFVKDRRIYFSDLAGPDWFLVTKDVADGELHIIGWIDLKPAK